MFFWDRSHLIFSISNGVFAISEGKFDLYSLFESNGMVKRVKVDWIALSAPNEMMSW
jgi:hypothetical protein